MRIARKLTLLAMLATAVAAHAAPSALAQISIEPEEHNQTPRLIVQQEVHAGGADVNCPAVVPSPPISPPALPPGVAGGGCRAHASGVNVEISGHDAAGAESLLSTCTIEFDLRVDLAGEGYVTHQELTPNAGCTRKACGQATPPSDEGRIWSFYMRENEVAGSPIRERFIVLICIEPIAGGAASHCELSVPISQPGTHRYRLTANDVNGHAPMGTARCELDGDLDVETLLGGSGEALLEQNIEIRHN